MKTGQVSIVVKLCSNYVKLFPSRLCELSFSSLMRLSIPHNNVFTSLSLQRLCFNGEQ